MFIFKHLNSYFHFWGIYLKQVKKMMIKKLLISLLIALFILPSFCLADDFLEENELDNFLEVSNDVSNPSKEPTTNSKNIVALDRKSLTVLYEKNAYKQVPMASTTKIMTAILVLENCDLSETVEFSKEAANVRGSCLEVSTGTKMSIHDVLYGLMMRSRKRLCGCHCGTHFWFCRKFCSTHEQQSTRTKSHTDTFRNTSWLR